LPFRFSDFWHADFLQHMVLLLSMDLLKLESTCRGSGPALAMPSATPLVAAPATAVKGAARAGCPATRPAARLAAGRVAGTS
jgi:hypothetical protein